MAKIMYMGNEVSVVGYSGGGGGGTGTRLPSGNEYDTDSSPSYQLVDYMAWRTFTMQAGTTHFLAVVLGSTFAEGKDTYIEVALADLPVREGGADVYATIFRTQYSQDLNMAMGDDGQTVYVSWNYNAVPVDFYENI